MAASGSFAPSMASGGGGEWRCEGCPGGARGLPYRDRGGREQVEAGPARQRRAHVRRRTGRWEQVREEEDNRGGGLGQVGRRLGRGLVFFLFVLFSVYAISFW